MHRPPRDKFSAWFRRLVRSRLARRFVRQEDGSTAVEFSLVAVPFLGLTFAILETALVFFAGQTLETAVTDSARLIMTGQAQDKAWMKDDFKTEVCNRIHGLFDCAGGVYAADRKVTLTAGALANLTSQSQTITVDGMTNILNASAAIIKPYSVGNLAATITCLKIDADGNAKVKWSATLNGTARADGASVTLPSAALAVPNSSLVWSEVNYNYTPVVGYTITGTLTLSDQMFMSPRVSPPVYNSKSCS